MNDVLNALKNMKGTFDGIEIPKDKEESNKKFNNKRNNSQMNNKTQGRNTYSKNQDKGGYVGAPYNFVPFPQKIYEYPEKEATAHNSVEEGLLSGEIIYEMTAETPIFVDSWEKDKDKKSKGEFYKNAYGKYSIPGSTVRGLIRNNVQVLGFSSFGRDIDDYALMYRNVANEAKEDKYNTVLGNKPLPVGNNMKISVLSNVKAGYIKKEGTEYYIYKTKVDFIDKTHGEMNYYVLSERKIGEEYMKRGKFSYDFFVCENGFRTQNMLDKKFGGKDENYRGKENKEYVPYFEKVSYEIKDLKSVTAVGKPGKYKNSGYVVSSGKMKGKKAVYIIPEIDLSKESIKIPKKNIEAFNADITKRENTLKQFGGRELFDLPKEGEMKPVFYIELGEKLYFGFTPRLRLFYDHTIKEGLSENHKRDVVDYASAIFGYSNEKGSYKSRVSFADAVLMDETPRKKNRVQLVLAEPKASSYLDYVKQEENSNTTYNTDGFQLRGVKQYWLHNKEYNEFSGKKNVASSFVPLAEGSRFSGKVRFHNLKREELGLLLWGIQLEKNSWMNVGKAKAYGYGNVSVKISELNIMETEKAYNPAGKLELFPYRAESAKEYIEDYKKFISQALDIKDLERNGTVFTFFNMKDSNQIPDQELVRYMSIDKKEYQSRKQPLPSVNAILKKKK